MSKIRVLVVDDSTLIRRLLLEVLAGDPAVEVAGTASNGRIALAKIPLLHPDLVILDVEMPELDGLETLSAIRQDHPWLPVIMFSAHTERGAAITLDALSRGAADYVTKPSNLTGMPEALERVRAELLPKVKAICRPEAAAATTRAGAQEAPPVPPAPPRPDRDKTRVDIVAIGVSTGGPAALEAILPALPADFPAPILIVQHMPPMFTKLLAERLASRSAIRVREGSQGDLLQSGAAWIAPGDFHLVVQRDKASVRIRTHQGDFENACRPSVDALFRSVAEVYGDRSLAVVLTGMGQDGLRGCELLLQAGAQIFVQDEATSIVWGMPGFVVRSGIADRVLPLDKIADAIMQRVRVGRSVQA